MAIPPVDTSSSDANDETSPLLPRRSASPSTHTRKDDISHHRNRRRWSSASICLLLLIIIVCLEFADTVPRPALTRIYEAMYCRQYYLEHGFPGDGKEGGAVGGRFGGWAGFGDGKLALSIPEKYCKVPQVQGEVALLKAWQVAFDAAGSMSVFRVFSPFPERLVRHEQFDFHGDCVAAKKRGNKRRKDYG
ncbi:hypothetical protein HDK64DRAFT_284149 [Phyllosticta capitalensis]